MYDRFDMFFLVFAYFHENVTFPVFANRCWNCSLGRLDLEAVFLPFYLLKVYINQAVQSVLQECILYLLSIFKIKFSHFFYKLCVCLLNIWSVRPVNYSKKKIIKISLIIQMKVIFLRVVFTVSTVKSTLRKNTFIWMSKEIRCLY